MCTTGLWKGKQFLYETTPSEDIFKIKGPGRFHIKACPVFWECPPPLGFTCYKT